MTITREEVLRCVIDSIRDMMTETPDASIEEDTDPIQNLGLDSFDGVACACSMSDRLGFDIPTELNPFVDDKKNRSRSVQEIVDLLYALLKKKAEDSHE